MIRHIVAFQMAAADVAQRAADAAECARRLNALVGVVPSLRAMTAGANMLALGTNWDVALVADFDDEAGLEAYLVHPDHEAAAAYIGTVRGDRVAVDILI